MLTQLAQDLKDRNLSNGILTKMVLVNIAAQSFAIKRASRKKDHLLSMNEGPQFDLYPRSCHIACVHQFSAIKCLHFHNSTSSISA